MSRAYSELFSGRGHQFCHFFKRIFPAELILKNLSAKNDSRGVREHAPQEKNLKISILQWPFSCFLNNFYGKFVIFLAPNFERFTNDAFCSHSFDYV